MPACPLQRTAKLLHSSTKAELGQHRGIFKQQMTSCCLSPLWGAPSSLCNKKAISFRIYHHIDMVKHARDLMKALFSHARSSSHCGDLALAFPLLPWSLLPTNKTVLVCYPTNLGHKYILNVLAGISHSLFSSSFIVFSLGLEMVTDGKAEMVQLVKNWLCKYKNSGSTPSTHRQTLGAHL